MLCLFCLLFQGLLTSQYKRFVYVVNSQIPSNLF